MAILPGTGSAGASTPVPMDVYRAWLVNSNSGYCLAASESPGEQPVVQTGCSGEVVDWSIVDLAGTDRHSIDTAYGPLRCVAARGTTESQAVATDCWQGYDDQVWHITHNYSNNTYQFRNVNSKLCLAARGTSMGTPAIQTTCGAWADQWWWIYPE
ncbi:hypothetical protein FHX82_001340 [Amycolatopsis bartoniae]|nr:RICIN domain-containing protein [Amycolatopsis bartoniae]MBB2934320.1 hypothetical protein [Amycolatopsis bartoniae]